MSSKKGIYILIIVLVALAVILAGFSHARYGRYFPRHIFRNYNTLSPADVSYIRNWMTFNYINRIFNLPTDYLKDKLAITDKEYPNISIAQEAKKEKIPENDFLTSVKEAVGQYFSAAPK